MHYYGKCEGLRTVIQIRVRKKFRPRRACSLAHLRVFVERRDV